MGSISARLKPSEEPDNTLEGPQTCLQSWDLDSSCSRKTFLPIEFLRLSRIANVFSCSASRFWSDKVYFESVENIVVKKVQGDG